jgi:hypothetical protein
MTMGSLVMEYLGSRADYWRNGEAQFEERTSFEALTLGDKLM